MAVSYNGLWKLLIDKNMKKVDMMNQVGISSSTVAKMTNGEAGFHEGSGKDLREVRL